MRLRTQRDIALDAAIAEFRRMDPAGERTAGVLRDTFDSLYDGQRTGRYRWEQLFKTEMIGCGPLVEINLHREFNFADGEKLDYRIADVEVDCKYSQTRGGWMIPPEAHGHVCLLVWADDSVAKWSLGIVRVTTDRLNTGGNRDCKATLNASGRSSIFWLFDVVPLPPNILLQLPKEVVDRIMRQPSGQQKINELFRSALGMRVGRAVVATVAQQPDYMKRVRANGGARTALQPEGIIILGQYESHCAVAEALKVPAPGRGESVSVRVVPAKTRGPGVAKINGRLWRVAKPGDAIVPAPLLPNV